MAYASTVRAAEISAPARKPNSSPKSLPCEDEPIENISFAQHLQTYRRFLLGLKIFVAHVAVILLLLYYFLG